MVKTKDVKPAVENAPERQPRQAPARAPEAAAPARPVFSMEPRSNGVPAGMHAANLMSSSPEFGGTGGRARMAASMQKSLGNARMGRMITAHAATAPDTAATAAPAVEAAVPSSAAPSATQAQHAGSANAASTAGAPSSTHNASARKAGAAISSQGAAPANASTSTATAEGTSAAAQESGANGAGKLAAKRSPLEAIAPAAGAIRHRAAVARKHSDAGVAVGSAQAAGIKPDTEQARFSAEQTVENLSKAKADGVKPNDFKAELTAAVHQATPQPTTESQADDLVKNGAKKVSGIVGGQLSAKSSAAADPLKAAEADAPAIKPPAPPELKPEQVGAPPALVSAASIVPAPLPAEQLDYSSDRAPTDRAMEENNVTEEQLAKGNEPQFGSTLAARSNAETHEAAVPSKYRTSEAAVQAGTHRAAQQEIVLGLVSLHGARGLQIGKVAVRQTATVARNLAERQRITDAVTGMRNQTRTDVENILKSMEDGAAQIFEPALAKAEEAFEQVFKDAKGGIGKRIWYVGRWDEHIADSLETARDAYLVLVDQAVDQVAKLVDEKLEAAKTRVADGLNQVKTFVNGLDDSVKQFGEEALQAVSTDFDTLSGEIDQRRDALVTTLADQYKASYSRMSAMEEKLREENRSLWKRVYDATVGVIKKIIAFKDMLLSVLSKAAGVIVDIISDPIGFLGNLISGVMQGLKNFKSNIGTHLMKGLTTWLLGALAGTGLKLPDTFDLEGIVSVVLQILGLTYATFRARAVAVVGEPVVAKLEHAAEIFKIVMTQGVSGLWTLIKDKVADVKSMVLDAVFDFIKESVFIAGISWIVGLLNPASAFFKACKAIYDIVMFFINHGSEILELVNAVIDSIAAIAKGAIGIAATAVENALAKAIPVAIGFLASLLGLGDISGTVKKIIDKAQAPVHKAIDWVVNMAVKGGKALLAAVGIGGKEGKEGQEGKKDGESPDVRTQVSIAISERLTSEHTREQAVQIAAQIEKEFQPKGLKSLEIGPENDDGESIIYVEASPKLPLFKLLPQDVIPRTPKMKGAKRREDVDVKMVVEIKIEPTQRNMEKFGDSPSTPSVGLAAFQPGKIPPADTRTRRESGGMVFTPKKKTESEVPTLHQATWNAPMAAQNETANTSHAEHQFDTWLTERAKEHPDFLGQITEITININYSPCTACCDMLAGLLREIEKARGKGNAPRAVLAWEKLYRGNKKTGYVTATTSQSLRYCNGWQLFGPKPTDTIIGHEELVVQPLEKLQSKP